MKKTALLLCGAMFLMGLAGCGGNGGQSASERNAVTRVEILSEPKKTDYYLTDSAIDIDVTGGKLSVVYADGSTTTIDITENMIGEVAFSAVGETTVPITYEGKTTEYSVTVHTKPQSLNGMNLVWLGSSSMYGATTNGYSYVDYISDNHGATCVKNAIPGTTLVHKPEGGRPSPSQFISRLNNITSSVESAGLTMDSTFHHFVCFLTTNDAGVGYPLGNIVLSENLDDFDLSTITGCVQYIILKAKETFNCPVTFHTAPQFNNGYTARYVQMVDMLFDLQEQWSVPFGILDFWYDEEFNAKNCSAYMASDGIHPTLQGYEEWYAPAFVEYLLNNTYID